MNAEPINLTPFRERERLGEYEYEVLRPMPKLATALAKAQAEMPAIEKTRTANAGTFSYKYADLADIFAAVRPVLAKHELAVTQDVQVKDGRVLCFTMIWHSSGESHSFGPVTLNAGSTPQNAGSAITYARRYSLSAALGIATEEDDDAQHASKTEAKPQRRKPVPSGPQSEPAPTHTRDEQPQDSKATADNAAADVARKGNETPEELAAALGAPPASSPSKDEAVKAFIEALERRFPNKSKTVKLAYVNRWVKDDVKLTDVNENQIAGSFTEEELKNLTVQILKEVG